MRRGLQRVAYANAGLAVVATLTAIAIYLVRGHAELLFKDWTLTNSAAALLALLPALLARRRQHAQMIVVLMIISFAATTQVVANLVTEVVLPSPRPLASSISPATMPRAAAWATWSTFWAWLPAVGLLATSVLLRFPSGEVVGRWRIVVERVAWAGIALAAAGFAWTYRPWSTTTLETLNETSGNEPLTAIGMALVGASALVSIADLVRRGTKAVGTERFQFRWFATGTIVFSATMVISIAFEPSEQISSQGIQPATLTLWASLPALVILLGCLSVAILRYRLYDVDVVISRSLLVAGLALFILVIYVGVVVGIGTLVTDSNEPNLALQIGATALVAVGFQPWRRRLRNWVDRVVYGHRASPYDVLGAFASMGRLAPGQSKSVETAKLLADGTGAEPARVWQRIGDALHCVASHPVEPLPSPVPFTGEELPALPGDVSVPVVMDGVLLGALTLDKRRGEPATDQDLDVTRRLATGVAQRLQSDRLTAELAQRRDELHDSRARIVRAQDDARRRLERDLHDGAQQQLVAVKVKLGLARTTARTANATQAAAILDQVHEDANEAVESLRDLARGIYPPLLEAEGLPTAIQAQARKAPLPVVVVDRGIGRAHPEVEIAVYFCVLEALQNVAKYAGASSARVTLDRDADTLSFTVEDDGRGFDPDSGVTGTGLAGMHDRIDTVGGRLTVTATPGGGTTVAGEVPVGAPTLAGTP